MVAIGAVAELEEKGTGRLAVDGLRIGHVRSCRTGEFQSRSIGVG